MTVPLAHIQVFKTTIQTLTDKQCVETFLNAHAEIQEWTIDLQDVDCVLRIISASLTPDAIIYLINQLGYTCVELE